LCKYISLFAKRRQKQHTDKNRQKDTHSGLKAKLNRNAQIKTYAHRKVAIKFDETEMTDTVC